MELEQRVRRLERSARVWRCATVGAVLLAGVVGLAPRTGEKVIECNELIIRDSITESSFSVSYDTVEDKRYLAAISSMYEVGDEYFVDKSGDLSVLHGKNEFGFYSNKMNITDDPSGLRGRVGDMTFNDNSVWFLNSEGKGRVGVGVDENESGYMQIQNHHNEKAAVVTSAPTMSDPDGPDRVGLVMVLDPGHSDNAEVLVPKQ